MSDVNDLRRELLGQMSITEARIEKLRGELINEPEYSKEKPPVLSGGTVDAMGNLSFQTGILIGVMEKYKDAVVSPWDADNGDIYERIAPSLTELLLGE